MRSSYIHQNLNTLLGHAVVLLKVSDFNKEPLLPNTAHSTYKKGSYNSLLIYYMDKVTLK